MKCCSKCLIEKEESAFYRSPRYKEELSSFCKDCKKQQGREYRRLNPEKRKSKRRQDYLSNKDSCLLKSAQWYKLNSAHIKLKSAEWKRLNPDKHCAAQAKRHAFKIRAMPPWLTKEHFEEIESYYTLAKELQWLSEDLLEVDHIVPLQGKTVSGLHVPWNLQILPKSLNRIKSNKW